ncbi:MAG: Rid family hydrolase [bacterium]|nr:Rid family hydrolase [bacterium]
MGVQMINPEGLHTNQAFTHVAVVTGPHKTIYIGGQNGVDAQGSIAVDFKAQAEQVFANLTTALAAAGAGIEHVIKWNIYTLPNQPIHEAFMIFQRIWAGRPNPPLITYVAVVALANPDFLMELEAVAIVPMGDTEPNP